MVHKFDVSVCYKVPQRDSLIGRLLMGSGVNWWVVCDYPSWVETLF